jgi:hypothetical protein
MDKEQLDALHIEADRWGIRRRGIPVPRMAAGNPEIPESMARGFDSALADTISISLEEKKRVVASFPKLSLSQVEELLRILKEERRKFTLLGPEQQGELLNKSDETWEAQKNWWISEGMEAEPED